MISTRLEFASIHRRSEVRLVLALYVLTVFATGVRAYSGAVTSGSSILAISISDDRTWYLAVLTSAIIGAVSSSLFFSTRRSWYSWSNGVTLSSQFALRNGYGAVLGALCALLYWVIRVGSATASIRFAPHAWAATGGVGLPVQLAFAGRLVLMCALVGVIGVTIGIFTHRPVAAVALSVALFSSLLPVFDVLATRFPLLVNLQSYTPGGAATTVLESNAGIATSSGLLSLRHGRPAIVGLAVLFAWAVALISAGLVRRSRSEDPNHTAFTRVIKVLLLTTSVVVLLAAVLPYMARTAFPWYLKPAWLHDVARGSSSIDAVDEFVASLRRGESPSPYVDPGDALWQPIRNGSVDVVDERSLTRPDVVAVGVTDPDDVSRQYTYEFELVRVANGWEVTRVHSAID